MSSPTHRRAQHVEVGAGAVTTQLPAPSRPPSSWRRLGSALDSWSSNSGLLRHSSLGNAPLPTGTWVQGTYYVVSTVGAPFLLGLPSAVAQLGWGPGIAAVFLAYLAVLWTATVTVRLHEYKGARHTRYRELGQAIFGKTRGAFYVLPFQMMVNVGMCVTYDVIAGQALRGVCTSLSTQGDCGIGLSVWIVVFSSAHLALALLPDISSIAWVNALGALMTIGFSVLATIGAALAGRGPDVVYSVQGSPADKAFNAFTSLGAITLLYGNILLVETQSTLKAAPSAVPPMVRSVLLGYTIVASLLLSCVISGYWAFGAAVQPFVLDSIGKPVWLVVTANFLVVVNSLAGYLMFAHCLFDYVDLKILMSHWTGLEFQGGFVVVLKRFSFRWFFVVTTAGLAVCLPFFQDLMGFLGAVGYCPLCFILPCLMWLKTQQALRWYEIAACWGIIVAFVFVGLTAAIGSIRSLVVHASTYEFFT